MAEVSTPMKSEFLSRVVSFPLVVSAIDIAGNGYNRVKNYNNLVNSTLNIGERSVQFVAQTANPLLATLEKPINYADKMACQGLDKLEGAVPVIKNKPEDFVKKYEDLVKMGSDRVKSFKDYGYQKVNNVMSTSYVQTVAGTVDSAISMTENAIERYLPRAEDEPVDDPGNRNVIQRVSVISDKMRRRMYRQAMNNLTAVQKRSQEALDRMKFSVDLIGIAKNFDPFVAAKNQATWLWEELNKEEPLDDGQPKTYDKRILNFARRATKQVVTRFEDLSKFCHNLPITARKTMDITLNYFRGIYEELLKANTVRDISNLTIDQMILGWSLMQTLLDKMFTSMVGYYTKKEEKKE